MKKFLSVIAVAMLSSSVAFAHADLMGDSSCEAIVKACKSAGYARKSEDKKFWQDCMQPVLLGKSVSGVKIDADQVKTCRDKKIDEIQKELKDLQDVK